MRHVLSALMLLFATCSVVGAESMSDIGDYRFIWTLSGDTLERRINDVDGTTITAANGCDNVVIDSVRIDGYALPCYQTRVWAYLTVTSVVNSTVFTTPATVVYDAQLQLTGIPDNVALVMSVAPETMSVSADMPFDTPAERTVRSLRDRIAAALNMSSTMNALTLLAKVIPDPSNMVVDSYQEGIIYVIEIYVPATACPQYPPRIFRTGNAFTISLSKPVVEALMRRSLQTDALVKTFNEKGVPDIAGDITINDIDVQLCHGSMLLSYLGTDKAGNHRVIRWLMQFVRGRYGTEMQAVKITVDGVAQPLPAEDEYINPVSRSIAIVTEGIGQDMKIIVSPLGLSSLTYGEIRPTAIVIAGRLW